MTKSSVERVTTLVENSTSPSPWFARIGRTAKAGAADWTTKVLNSMLAMPCAVNCKMMNMTTGAKIKRPINVTIVSLSNLIVDSPALAKKIPM